MISIAIPFHGDRFNWTMKTVTNCHKLSYVSEIVICIEPGSESGEKLKRECRLYRKVKLFFNDKRLFVFRNKINAVEKCGCEWVALIDSDNLINAAYLGGFINEKKNPMCIYHPSVAHPKMDFSEFIGVDIGYNYAAEHLGDLNFNKFFNNMNYVLHRKTWLKALDRAILAEYDPSAADSAFINQQCLKAGMVIKVLFAMTYVHNVHRGSTYLQNQEDGVREYQKIIKAMKEDIHPGQKVELGNGLNWSGYGVSQRPAALGIVKEGLITD